MQTSAEYQALCRQTFNSAIREIKQTARKAKRRHGRPVGPNKKPLAVVADLDETLLDNARFQSEMDAAVWADGMDIGFTSNRWEQWERDNPVEVGLVPGAGPFIAEVEKLKIVMVYVSNRLADLKDSTIRALAHNGISTQGLELGTELRLLLKEPKKPGGSSKQKRISQVKEKYHVIAYLGDNLGDFPDTPEPTQDSARQLAARRQNVESSADLWGTRYFMLPNPVYGSWDQILPKTVQERMGLLKRAVNQGFVRPKPPGNELSDRPSPP
jgi:acid phosphatase